MMSWFVRGLAFVAAALFVAPGFAQNVDVQPLLQGVSEVKAPGAIPGPLAVFGETAAIVLAGQAGKQRPPLIAAARYERGRVVALGHGGFLDSGAIAQPDNERFTLNCVAWTAQNQKGSRIAVVDKPAVADLLEKNGYTVLRLTAAQLQDHVESPDFDVIITSSDPLDGKEGERIALSLFIFVRGGGGVIMDSLGWGWLQLHPGQTLPNQHGGNKLFARFGICWSDGFLDRTGKEGWRVDVLPTELSHARTALVALQKHADGSLPRTDADLEAITDALGTTMMSIPGDEPRFLPQVGALIKRFASEVTFPIGLNAPFARLKVISEMTSLRRAPLDRRPAHPSSGTFPGAVPLDATRVANLAVTLPPTPGWHGLGVYAIPGAPVTIQIPERFVGKGLAVQIGAHTDTLWHLPRWDRFPEITVRKGIVGKELKLTSAFGGTVFLDLPSGLSGGDLTVAVSGAVLAPRFQRGVTSLDSWKALRQAPGPWAELEGKNIILSVPSSVVRSLDDPEALMAYWDEVGELAERFYAVKAPRVRPERYTVDKQISAGYMHAGYPIMTGDDVAARFVDLVALRGKDGGSVWGFYHELGHNFQRDWWTFEGTGEVTNNFFALFACEKLNGVRYGHPAAEPAKTQERLREYLAAGAPYERWKSDPFLALTLFIQLRDAFGWDPFQRVFAEYENAPKASLPKSDQEKRDQLMVRLSRAVNKNLGPFFTAWGVPTSDAARVSIDRLPRWMPKNWPK